MPTFAEVRAKYPQYQDMSDQQLAEGLHKKFYSDMPFDQFAAKVGYTEAAPVATPVPQMRGKGYMDAEAIRRGGFNPLTGAGEAALQVGTGLGASVLAGGAGIGQGVKNIFAPGMPAADRVRKVQETLTYKPRTASGQEVSDAIASPKNPLNWPGVAGEYLGDKSADAGLPPWLSTSFRMAPEVATVFAGSKVKAVGERPQVYKEPPKPVPKTAEIEAASDALYKASEDAGVVIRPESTARAARILQSIADEERLGKLPPKLKEAHDILVERLDQGKPLTLRDADKVRGIINESKSSTEAADRRLGMIAQQRYDKYIDGLDGQDLLSGDKELGVALLKQARDAWKRRSHSKMLDEMEHRARVEGQAKYTQAGEEHSLRTQFKNIAIDPDELARYTPEQQAAITKVAAPGIVAGTYRNLGKMDPLRGGVPAAIATGVGGSLGAVGGPAGSLAGIAATGALGRLGNVLATRATKANVAAVRESLVGRGLPKSPDEIAQALAEATAKKPKVGELLAREPLALPPPTIISGPRSAPGSMYAREQMGLTPDVEMAGLQHPGMARENIPRPPLALPYLPEQPIAKPMVVDPSGRVAPNAAVMQEYLKNMGLEGLNKVRQPAANPTPPTMPPEIAEALLGVKKSRSVSDVRSEIRRLEQWARALTPDQMNDGVTAAAISQEWGRLQAELTQLESRAARKR